jgi:hypothetical protein
LLLFVGNGITEEEGVKPYCVAFPARPSSDQDQSHRAFRCRLSIARTGYQKSSPVTKCMRSLVNNVKRAWKCSIMQNRKHFVHFHILFIVMSVLKLGYEAFAAATIPSHSNNSTIKYPCLSYAIASIRLCTWRGFKVAFHIRPHFTHDTLRSAKEHFRCRFGLR